MIPSPLQLSPPGVVSQEETVRTADDFTLWTTCYLPDTAEGPVVLIGSAMGVHQPYYRNFARFLAAHGYTVYTFDYRGVGKSQSGSLRHCRGTLTDWGTQDLAALILHLRRRHPGRPLTYIGHSISGQLLALTPGKHFFSRIVLVNSQQVDWRLWPASLRLGYACLVYLLIPLITYGWGYFPGRRLKVLWDLPKGIALELTRWCRSRGGLFGHRANASVRDVKVPLLAVGFADDWIAPIGAMHALLQRYGRADVTHWHLTPRELGVHRVGHFGFFRHPFKESLWAPVLAWLARDEPQAASSAFPA